MYNFRLAASIKAYRVHCLYVVVVARCGGLIDVPNGTVTSPGYPNGTETGTDCRWTVQVPRGHYIEFTFIDLSVENADASGQCRDDSFVEIRDYNETGEFQR